MIQLLGTFVLLDENRTVIEFTEPAVAVDNLNGTFTTFQTLDEYATVTDYDGQMIDIPTDDEFVMIWDVRPMTAIEWSEWTAINPYHL